MGEIKIAIAGVGNCASSLIQGLFYYKNIENKEKVPGIMHNVLGGYKIRDIIPVAAFDIDERKVGKDLSEAIFSKPNCTKVFYNNLPLLGVIVKKAPVLDGFANHMNEYSEDRRFRVSREEECDVVVELERSGAEVLINYMPVGSQLATEFYANAALEANCAFVNCMPVFIASNCDWAKKFEKKKLLVCGDDLKSQIGATIVHRNLAKLFDERGVKIDRTYQLNFGGNTDFLVMLERSRLKLKKISKTEAVQSMLEEKLMDENIHIGPSDYVPSLRDNKICYLRIDGRIFGNIPISLELRLSVEDSPNSAGMVIDVIRCSKLALDRNIGGVLTSISAYSMKHPPVQYADFEARKLVEDFIDGKIER